MTETWVITSHYFQRMARKPFLIVFLLAIPFTLLLAEFAAFGRTEVKKTITPQAIWFRSDGIASPVADRFVSCLAGQSGRPLQIDEVSRDVNPPRDVPFITVAARSPLRLSLQGPNSGPAFLLAKSVMKICAARASQSSVPIYAVNLQRAAPEPRAGALKSRAFFARFFPGLALFGALFLCQSMASLVWRDQELTVQQRLLTMPVRPSALVFGPVLFLTSGALLALLLLLAVCAFGTNPSALLFPSLWAIAIGFALCSAGLQLSLGFLARSQRAAQAMSASSNMMLAFFGGGFVPLSLYPPLLRNAAYGLPNGAAQAGITQLFEGEGHSPALLWRVSTVFLWAAVLVCTAIALQGRRLRS